MIRNLQHARLVKASSALRLARRQVYFDASSSSSSSSSSASSSSGLFLATGPGTSRMMAQRTFSSSRPYATALHSDELPSPGLPPPPPPSASVAAGLRLHTVLVRPPSKEALDEEDADVLEDVEARFQISPRAAEVCLLSSAQNMHYITLANASCRLDFLSSN